MPFHAALSALSGQAIRPIATFIAIGTSAGWFEAALRLPAQEFLKKFPASMIVMIHLPLQFLSSLDQLFDQAGPLVTAFAKEDEVKGNRLPDFANSLDKGRSGREASSSGGVSPPLTRAEWQFRFPDLLRADQECRRYARPISRHLTSGDIQQSGLAADNA